MCSEKARIAADISPFSMRVENAGSSILTSTVQVQDAHGCLASQSIDIQSFPPLEIITEGYVLPCAEPTVSAVPCRARSSGAAPRA